LSTVRRNKLSDGAPQQRWMLIKVLFHSALDERINGQWLDHGVVMALFPLLTMELLAMKIFSIVRRSLRKFM
jgi:hypothetical protein